MDPTFYHVLNLTTENLVKYTIPPPPTNGLYQVCSGLYTVQLPHSYYFTTRILVLKFVNKGVFFEEFQDSHFPRKRGYFGTHLREFGEKGVSLDVQCFTMKKGVNLG